MLEPTRARGVAHAQALAHGAAPPIFGRIFAANFRARALRALRSFRGCVTFIKDKRYFERDLKRNFQRDFDTKFERNIEGTLLCLVLVCKAFARLLQ